jgi:anaerobic selenocysteine-containing dehydrogenase
MSETHVKRPPEEAAGLGAALSTTKVAATMGVARGVRTLLRLNQQGGFDCPGCAWPEPRTERSLFEFCENGVKHVADEATPLRADAELFAAHAVDRLAEQSDEWLNAQGRLTEPMVLREGATHYEPISWDDAFALIALELRKMPSPNAGVFYTSGATKRRSSTSSSRASSGPTTCRTARTCATSRAARR